MFCDGIFQVMKAVEAILSKATIKTQVLIFSPDHASISNEVVTWHMNFTIQSSGKRIIHMWFLFACKL